jgi:hypothetical protein
MILAMNYLNSKALRGQIINFTTFDGRVERGILMPYSYSKKIEMPEGTNSKIVRRLNPAGLRRLGLSFVRPDASFTFNNEFMSFQIGDEGIRVYINQNQAAKPFYTSQQLAALTVEGVFGRYRQGIMNGTILTEKYDEFLAVMQNIDSAVSFSVPVELSELYDRTFTQSDTNRPNYIELLKQKQIRQAIPSKISIQDVLDMLEEEMAAAELANM